ncbi:metallophosphoesterase [Actinokineospora soli]|uniref:Metallophosphoesterase n=1 Tax=Actinokineospora soli TaxID=1048753 RepID=A0ABW2TRX3_9PSEU
MGNLLAVSDLHITYDENREITAGLQPESADDWLIVAGDIAEKTEDVRWALDLLSQRFAQVVWTPATTSCGPRRATPTRPAAWSATRARSPCAANWAC